MRTARISGALALLLSFWGSQAAGASDLAALRSAYRTEMSHLASLDSSVVDTSLELDRLSAEIQSLKGQRRASGLLGGYRLQTLLQRAQEVSTSLDSLVARHRQAELKCRKAQRALSAALQDEMDRLRGVANSRSHSTPDRLTAGRAVEQLSWERMRVMLSPEEPALPTHGRSLLGNGDTPEEIRERLAAIHDFEKRLAKEVDAIEAEMQERKRERFVHAEVGRLMEEEAFFGERSFVRGPGREKSEAPSAGMRATNALPGTPSAPETLVPSMPSPADALPSSESAEPVGMNESLTKLASDFGIAPTETRELQDRPATSGDGRGYWLEERLRVMKEILAVLRNKAHKLESRLETH